MPRPVDPNRKIPITFRVTPAMYKEMQRAQKRLKSDTMTEWIKHSVGAQLDRQDVVFAEQKAKRALAKAKASQ